MTDGLSSRRGVPDVTVGRLASYLRALEALSEQGVASVSSQDLAEKVGVGAAQLRKDLSHLGSYGTRGVGYDVAALSEQIARELGLTRSWPVVIVGAGNLGRALADYQGLGAAGFPVVALCDVAPDLVGTRIGGLEITTLDRLEAIPPIGVITTPAEAAQEVCDALVERGVTSILNFAPVPLTVPDGVDVRSMDVARELQILSFHQEQRATERREAAVEEVQP